jgi:hypothetical protein
LSPGRKEAKATKAKKEISPVKATMEGASEYNGHDKCHQDGIEDQPWQQQCFSPGSKTTEGNKVTRQGQGGKKAHKDT